jgi:hypothetical protein
MFAEKYDIRVETLALRGGAVYVKKRKEEYSTQI